MARVKRLGPALRMIDTRIVRPPPKQADPYYLTPEHRAWRTAVIARAGGRCEQIDNGARCTKAEPQHRMFADHIRERQDGGADLDLANGQCLCGAHHSRKTMAARSRRHGTSGG